MKKVISAVLVIVLAFGLITAALASNVNISVSKTAVSKGETVDVKLTLDSAMSNITNFEYSLYFNPELYELQSSAVGTALPSAQISNLKTDSKGSFYSISFVDATSEGVTVSAGVIYTLTFKAKTDIGASSASQFEVAQVSVMDTTWGQVADAKIGTATVSVQVNTETAPEETGFATITTSVSGPKSVKNAAGTEFNAIVYASDWDAKGYKLIDAVINIPEGVEVTSVTAGDRLSGGTVYYNKAADNKLRIAYNDINNMTTLSVSGTEKPIPMFIIGLKLTSAAAAQNGTISVGGMSFKINSDSEAADSMNVVLPATEADVNGNTGSVTFAYSSDAVTVSASELFIGDGVDIIPETKKAIVVKVSGLSNVKAKLTFTKGEASTELLYSAEISDAAKCSAYVAIVDKDAAIADFAAWANYTADTKTDAAAITFGDTNGDTVVNAQDALNIINAWLRKTEITDDQDYLTYNVNADSRINTFDALGVEEAFVNMTTMKIVTKAAAVNA